ncbi:uncharacterized protein LOC105191431 isoform X2 [Harpegnathos saltator]|uniref:uncharacterized protein LOC105191431 isoform X2 n=1 Tax=Harpegnathos saltator TaxID=610380 RepID=UPI0009488C8A|nr:uncharacterized protein LOC105191431 isoform X2 [Harpegnathos saltator]XP_019700745.1 uncharacterized protein LOC105191431 isoform X2 [Harpegnathos saltator]
MEDEVEKIGNMVMKFLGAVMNGPIAKDHLLGALCTGVSYLVSADVSTYLNNIPAYKFLQNSRFVDYYGLEDNELMLLLNNVIPEKERDQVRDNIFQFYNGYYHQNTRVCCLWSVLHYVRHYLNQSDESLDFWDGSPLSRGVAGILKHSSIQEDMLVLMGGGSKKFQPLNKVDATDLANLFQLIRAVKQRWRNVHQFLAQCLQIYI